MHFALMCPPYAGHLNPMFALGEALRGRGHRSTFVAVPDMARVVEAAGFKALQVGDVSHPPGSLIRMERNLTLLSGLRGLHSAIRDMAVMTDMLCYEGALALRQLAPDAIVTDQLEAAGGLLARHIGLPFVSVANALMLDREPYIPPPFTDWSYARTRWACSRNRGGYRVSDWLMSEVSQVICRWSDAWRLPHCRTVEDCMAPVQVGQMSQALDYPRESLPDGFTYTGPLRRPIDTAGTWQPPPQRRPPFAFVSLGSLQGGRFELISAITQACRDSGMTPIVAHGGRLSQEQCSALPGDPIVETFVAQRRVIECCELVITHGGMNTVLDALSLGVTLVLVPLAMEQGAISERVVRAGVGVRVRSRSRSVSGLRKSIEDALGRRGTDRTLSMAASLQAAGGAARAAELIERHAA